ncbi:CDP-alcohol phosphatidyltransferase family protein [Salinigranum sp. GCM10025319]|uniref:CDP-alcohol phosphatidyltransferase family protein n=1 Tax=Salinigranum sp. GCM10025319 TaxID=3252687 RepID=UPI003609E41D
MSSADSPSAPPAGLRRRWWATAGVFAVAAGVVALALGRAFDERTAGLWLAAAAPVFGYELWFLRRTLDRNHPPDSGVTGDEPGDEVGDAVEDEAGDTVGDEAGDDAGTEGDDGADSADEDAARSPVPTLGVANAVTLGRGWLYAVVTGFLLVVPPAGSAWRWVPVVCYGTGAALDWVDGALARTAGRRSELGEKLDMAFDTLGFLVAPLVAVVWGRLPVWYLSISVARYLFKAGRGWRRARGLPVYDLPPSRVRRPLAGLQMAFITAALLPVVPVAAVRPAAAVVVAPSLVVFVRDYLVVSGRLGGSAEPQAKSNAVDRSETIPER